MSTVNSVVKKLLKENDVRKVISEATKKPEWKVKNIVWDVSVDDITDDIYDNYSEMTDKECAKALGISKAELKTLMDDVDAFADFIESKFDADPAFGNKWFNLPAEYDIPAGETDADGVADWLTDELGWTIKTLDVA